jgi:pyrroline-5-carboxylate reductase
MPPPTAAPPAFLPWPVALLGTGKLGAALLEGLSRVGLLTTGRVTATARRAEHCAALTSRFGIPVRADNREALEGARLVLLGTRAAQLPGLLAEVGPLLQPGQCVVSLAAGVPLAFLEHLLPPTTPVVRALTGTPVAVAAGTTVLAGGTYARAEDVSDVLRLFASVGQVHPVEEAHLEAANALVGAGPAFLYATLQALVRAGQAEGLPESLAHALATGSALGAARMATVLRLPLATLISQVASPGGASAAGLAALEESGLARALEAGVAAAARNTRNRARILLDASVEVPRESARPAAGIPAGAFTPLPLPGGEEPED